MNRAYRLCSLPKRSIASRVERVVYRVLENDLGAKEADRAVLWTLGIAIAYMLVRGAVSLWLHV